MGLKYDSHQFKRAGDRLNNSQKAFKRYLIRDMEKLARLVEASGAGNGPAGDWLTRKRDLREWSKKAIPGCVLSYRYLEPNHEKGIRALRLAIMRSTWSWASIVSAISPA